MCDRRMFLKTIVGIRKLWTDQDGWNYGAIVHVTSRPFRLVAYCGLIVREVSDVSVIRHPQETTTDINTSYSILCVRDGLEVDGNCNIISVLQTVLSVNIIISLLRRVS